MGAKLSKSRQSSQHEAEDSMQRIFARDTHDGYIQALARGLPAMDPPIEVYTGVLDLIAEFAVRGK